LKSRVFKTIVTRAPGSEQGSLQEMLALQTKAIQVLHFPLLYRPVLKGSQMIDQQTSFEILHVHSERLPMPGLEALEYVQEGSGLRFFVAHAAQKDAEWNFLTKTTLIQFQWKHFHR
jgi:hypothetical protein